MKKLYVLFLIVMLLVMGNNFIVFANEQTEKLVTDEESWKAVTWYPAVNIPVREDGNIIGICSVEIGFSRCKDLTTDKNYMDKVIVQCNVQGVFSKDKKVGYIEEIVISSDVPAGTKIMSSYPIAYGNDDGYKLEYSTSQSKTFDYEKDTLSLRNHSSIEDGLIKNTYDYKYSKWIWDWQKNQYANEMSEQGTMWVLKTNRSNYKMTINFVGKYLYCNGKSNWWTYMYDEINSTEISLVITTPS